MIKSSRNKQSGISLIEVLIAVVILSFGMLALTSLQAQLLRAGAEAKARAVATAFAQGQLESLRTFRSLTSGAGNYSSISTGSFGGVADPIYQVAGVRYYGCTQVRRFRMDPDTKMFSGPAEAAPFSVAQATGAINCPDPGDPNAAEAVLSTIPEFKEVTTNIGWHDATGEFKSIQLTDSIAAIAPDDALQLAKPPPEPTQGPTFEIDKSSLTSTPGIVPIATGANKTAASTNPTPTQFVDSLSSLTSFDVMSFVGTDANPDILKITRSTSVKAVSCVCSRDGTKTSDTLVSYEPTTWNGKRMNYELPKQRPNGQWVGKFQGSNSDAGISTICTVCCRDHHDSATKIEGVDPKLRVDPYRALQPDGSHQHYGYKKQGSGYVIAGGLLPVGPETSNEYVEACKIIEVGGRLRLAVDARQNNMLIAPMDAAQSGFEQSNFIDRYSDFVKTYTAQAVSNRPATYPSEALPAPDAAILASYADILQPPALNYATSTADRRLLSFGLYIDYLTPETLEAYNCAVAKNDTGDCKGFGTRDPLEFLPFFAINLASLGSWTSARDDIVNIDGAIYNPQGRLQKEGGFAFWGIGDRDTPVPGSENINISNSGLTATLPIDLDDIAATSFVTDSIDFVKKAGVDTSRPKLLTVQVSASSTITLQKIGVFSPVTVPCDYSPSKASSTCSVPANETLTTVRLSNFTTEEKVQGSTVIHDRAICLPNDGRIVAASVVLSNNGTINETLEFQVVNMNTTDHVLVIAIRDAGTSCDQGFTVSLTPSF